MLSVLKNILWKLLEKSVEFFNGLRMTTPEPWGWYHLLCLFVAILLTAWLTREKRELSELHTRRVFAIYGISTLIFELAKQLMLSIHTGDSGVYWSYSWYSAPFQYCTMPMYISLLLCIVKSEKLRDYLYSFLAFYSMVSMTLVMAVPNTVFCESTIINVHTMLLHGGGLVVALYVLKNRLVERNLRSISKGGVVFVILTAVALLLDIAVERSGINHGETFNMFFISPYYECSLPVYVQIQKLVPYPVFLFLYVFGMTLGAYLVLNVALAAERGTASLRLRRIVKKSA